MSVLDKLKFWKKDDSFAELDKQINAMKQQSSSGPPLGFGTGDPLQHSMDTGIPYEHPDEQNYSGVGYGLEPAPEKPLFSRQPVQQSGQQFSSTDSQSQGSTMHAQMELIAAKLDTIRVSLESINHRLVAVERALHVQDYEEPPRKRRGSW